MDDLILARTQRAQAIDDRYLGFCRGGELLKAANGAVNSVNEDEIGKCAADVDADAHEKVS